MIDADKVVISASSKATVTVPHGMVATVRLSQQSTTIREVAVIQDGRIIQRIYRWWWPFRGLTAGRKELLRMRLLVTMRKSPPTL